MIRGWLVALGTGLGVMWLISLGATSSSPVMTWLIGIAAILSFAGAAGTSSLTDRRTVSTGIFALSLGMFGVWLIGLTDGAVQWQTWGSFAFGCAFFVLGVASTSRKTTQVLPASESRKPPRKAA